MLHIKEPSPSNSRFASESRRVPQVLQRKQSMCHRLPAVVCQCYSLHVSAENAYLARRPFPLPRSRHFTCQQTCWRKDEAALSLPLRIPCTGIRRRPGPAETLGSLPASPWWPAAAISCRVGAAIGATMGAGAEAGRRDGRRVQGAAQAVRFARGLYLRRASNERRRAQMFGLRQVVRCGGEL